MAKTAYKNRIYAIRNYDIKHKYAWWKDRKNCLVFSCINKYFHHFTIWNKIKQMQYKKQYFCPEWDINKN